MCAASLCRLQTDTIDVYQLHDIEFGDKRQIINEAIPALQKLNKTVKCVSLASPATLYPSC